MRVWILLVTVVAMVWTITGCGDGVARSRRERAELHRRVLANDLKQINDDWDEFWLLDRPGRLSWWRVP